MKVEYLGLDKPSDGWLVKGEIYIVLAIEASKSGVSYRILSDASYIPVLHRACDFKIISNKIPSSWVVNVADIGRGEFLDIAPATWTIDFWERYIDQDAEAISIFERESYMIVAQED